MLDRTVYDTYVRILTRELVPALGCTEPIAIALAAAKAREALGEEPRRLLVKCSGNIIKNAKGVIVPTTGNMRGIDTSAVLGALAGCPALGLEVLSKVGPADLEATRQMLAQGVCTVELLDTPSRLHIIVEITGDNHTALAEIRDEHTNVVRIERDGERLFYKEVEEVADEDDTDLEALNLADILEFANTVDLEDVRPVIKRQIEYNTRIAQEGMTHAYGGRVGATLMRHVFFLPVFSTDPMPDNELLPDISHSFPSVRMGKKAPPKTGRVKRRLLTPLPVFGHSTQTYCYGQIWANFGLKNNETICNLGKHRETSRVLAQKRAKTETLRSVCRTQSSRFRMPKARGSHFLRRRGE